MIFVIGDRKYSDKSDEYVVKVHGYQQDKTNETGNFVSVLLCPECLSDDVEITEEWHDQTYQEKELYRLKYDKQFCRCKICQCKFERNWEASYDEKCVIVNPFLKSWQSSCPEKGCNGFGIVEMWSSSKEIEEKPANYEIDIYPLTIVNDRYNGTYSGSQFVAWNCQPYEVPEESQEDDITAAEFWSDETVDIPAYAVGDTIEDAIRNLHQKIESRKDGNNNA